MRAAISVAFTRSNFMASSARNTLPPSIGKAGMRLKTASRMFTRKRLNRKLEDDMCASMSSMLGIPPVSRSTKNSTMAITRFTAGPASATHSSCTGFSGIFSMLATPPMGNNTIFLVVMPYRFPVRACPNSCSSTQANNTSIKATPTRLCSQPCPILMWLNNIQPMRMRNVQWTKTSMPDMRPRLSDHFIR